MSKHASSPPVEQVHSWYRHGVLMEHYWYPPGPAGEMEPHTHADYQICVSLNAPGEYAYRGARQPVPARSVTIIHPHEIHAARDIAPRTIPAEFWVLYVPAEFVRELIGTKVPPFAQRMMSTSRRLFARFSALPHRLRQQETQLAHEAELGSAMEELLAVSGLVRDEAGARSAATRLERARRIIEESCAENLPLTALAREAGMSPGRFCREFHRRYGRPPHRYQVQARVERAKRLLAAGVSISEAATASGFADQSHLTRHFRSQTGTTPGRYHNFGRNVQDVRRHAAL